MSPSTYEELVQAHLLLLEELNMKSKTTIHNQTQNILRARKQKRETSSKSSTKQEK